MRLKRRVDKIREQSDYGYDNEKINRCIAEMRIFTLYDVLNNYEDLACPAWKKRDKEMA